MSSGVRARRLIRPLSLSSRVMPSLALNGTFRDIPVSLVVSESTPTSLISSYFVNRFDGVQPMMLNGEEICQGDVSVPSHGGRYVPYEIVHTAIPT